MTYMCIYGLYVYLHNWIMYNTNRSLIHPRNNTTSTQVYLSQFDSFLNVPEVLNFHVNENNKKIYFF